MKRLLTTGVPIVLLLSASPAWAAQRTVTLAVDNMYCSACPYIVKKTMASVPGVSMVDVSFKKKIAIVTYDDAKTTLDAVTKASTEAGYPAHLARHGS